MNSFVIYKQMFHSAVLFHAFDISGFKVYLGVNKHYASEFHQGSNSHFRTRLGKGPKEECFSAVYFFSKLQVLPLREQITFFVPLEWDSWFWLDAVEVTIQLALHNINYDPL